ncbi:MAG: hypothetical protein JEY96_16770 [Bacteroidales bacterium]|nr:hypothetical protein [Bacteroidales bacterium]
MNSFIIFGQDICDYGLHSIGKLKVKKNMKVVPYTDENGNYGLKERSNDSIIISAKYHKILDNYNDTSFVVISNNYYWGVINLKGDTLAPFYSGSYHFNDTMNLVSKIMACPVCINNKYNLSYFYFVNSKGECLITDYYPCPEGVETDNSELPKYLQYIQLAEKAKLENKVGAIYYCNKAIRCDTSNAATYFWGIKLFMDMNDIKESSILNAKYNECFPWVAGCIEKSLENEKNTFYLIRLNRYKKAFYKYYMKDKSRYDEACSDLKRLKKLVTFGEFYTTYN